jgi:hypothetical protein
VEAPIVMINKVHAKLDLHDPAWHSIESTVRWGKRQSHMNTPLQSQSKRKQKLSAVTPDLHTYCEGWQQCRLQCHDTCCHHEACCCHNSDCQVATYVSTRVASQPFVSVSGSNPNSAVSSVLCVV